MCFRGVFLSVMCTGQLSVASDLRHEFVAPYRFLVERGSYQKIDFSERDYYKVMFKNCHSDDASYLFAKSLTDGNFITELIDECHMAASVDQKKAFIERNGKISMPGSEAQMITFSIIYGFKNEQQAQEHSSIV